MKKTPNKKRTLPQITILVVHFFFSLLLLYSFFLLPLWLTALSYTFAHHAGPQAALWWVFKILYLLMPIMVVYSLIAGWIWVLKKNVKRYLLFISLPVIIYLVLLFSVFHGLDLAK